MIPPYFLDFPGNIRSSFLWYVFTFLPYYTA